MQKIKDINQGDLLTFRASDNKYKILLCTSIYKVRSPHYFTFAALTYSSVNKPSIKAVTDNEFLGIGNTQNVHFKYSDNELNKMWAIHPEIKPYFLGSYGLKIWRKDFMNFRDNFEIIDNLKIVNNLDKNGSSAMNISNWNFLSDFFSKNFIAILENRGQNLFKVEAIIRDKN